jgi:hypothetical protein
MPHIPVNHHLRSLYRGLAVLTALACIAFGVIGIAGGGPVLGIGANFAASVLALLIGVTVLVATLIGRNIDTVVNTAIGATSVIVGLAMLALLRTDGNILHFSVGTCVAAFVVGLVLGMAGLYGRVGPAEEQRREEAFRHGVADADPDLHPWHRDPGLHPEAADA